MFLFTHIEKCAGTTFNEVLMLTFWRYLHISKNKYGGNDPRNDLKVEDLGEYLKLFPSGIGGHSIRPCRNLQQKFKNPTQITFLRNPLDRYLSHYNHGVETGWQKSFDEFLNKKFYHNFMTVKIAGSENYKEANKYLSEFKFIGDANQYNRSINLLQEVLDVNFYSFGHDKNKRKNKLNYLTVGDLTNEQLLRAEQNNALDIKLYEEFISKKNLLSSYSSSVDYKKPSDARVKLLRKLEKYRKNKIREIRMRSNEK